MTPPALTHSEAETLHAQPHWEQVDFVSDLHLQLQHPRTLQAWADYLARTPADAIFILGDLFEVWVGDDILDEQDAFEAECARQLRAASQRCALYFLHGNRDFLFGEQAARHCGMRLLSDPTRLLFAGRRWLLSHGDALCLDDHDYLRFRAQVRQAGWQANFLAQPLSQRQAYARQVRQQSEQRKHDAAAYADVDTSEALRWLQAADAQSLIHGHTHRPQDHELGDRLNRHVLSDWDLDAAVPRAEVLRLKRRNDTAGGGCDLLRLDLEQAC